MEYESKPEIESRSIPDSQGQKGVFSDKTAQLRKRRVWILSCCCSTAIFEVRCKGLQVSRFRAMYQEVKLVLSSNNYESQFTRLRILLLTVPRAFKQALRFQLEIRIHVCQDCRILCHNWNLTLSSHLPDSVAWNHNNLSIQMQSENHIRFGSHSGVWLWGLFLVHGGWNQSQTWQVSHQCPFTLRERTLCCMQLEILIYKFESGNTSLHWQVRHVEIRFEVTLWWTSIELGFESRKWVWSVFLDLILNLRTLDLCVNIKNSVPKSKFVHAFESL